MNISSGALKLLRKVTIDSLFYVNINTCNFVWCAVVPVCIGLETLFDFYLKHRSLLVLERIQEVVQKINLVVRCILTSSVERN